MGMYTEILFKAELVKDVPEQVLDVLRYIIEEDHRNDFKGDLPDHELFQCSRWDMLGRGGSAYFSESGESFLKQDDYNQRWHIFMNANLKNYSGEIGKFFGWIQQYVAGHEGCFLGYELYEEDDRPIIYYKDEPSSWKFSPIN